AEQNLSWAERGRLTMPVAAVASTVGDLLARQLAAFADDLEAHLLPDSGHVVPIDAPQKAAEILLATAARGACARRSPLSFRKAQDSGRARSPRCRRGRRLPCRNPLPCMAPGAGGAVRWCTG